MEVQLVHFERSSCTIPGYSCGFTDARPARSGPFSSSDMSIKARGAALPGRALRQAVGVAPGVMRLQPVEPRQVYPNRIALVSLSIDSPRSCSGRLDAISRTERL